MLLKKIYLFFMDPKLLRKDNLDVVKYYNATDVSLINDSISFLELYIKREVYKKTGISYAEFKEMTRYEKNIALTFLNLILEEEAVVNEIAEKELSDITDGIDKQINSNDDVLRGFNLGKEYV